MVSEPLICREFFPDAASAGLRRNRKTVTTRDNFLNMPSSLFSLYVYGWIL
jgi:hypothetical protein